MKTSSYWCRGSDSNRYVSFETQDFKSYTGITGYLNDIAKSLCYRAFRAFFWFGGNRQIVPMVRRSVSRVSTNFELPCRSGDFSFCACSKCLGVV